MASTYFDPSSTISSTGFEGPATHDVVNDAVRQPVMPSNDLSTDRLAVSPGVIGEKREAKATFGLSGTALPAGHHAPAATIWANMMVAYPGGTIVVTPGAKYRLKLLVGTEVIADSGEADFPSDPGVQAWVSYEWKLGRSLFQADLSQLRVEVHMTNGLGLPSGLGSFYCFAAYVEVFHYAPTRWKQRYQAPAPGQHSKVLYPPKADACPEDGCGSGQCNTCNVVEFCPGQYDAVVLAINERAGAALLDPLQCYTLLQLQSAMNNMYSMTAPWYDDSTKNILVPNPLAFGSFSGGNLNHIARELHRLRYRWREDVKARVERRVWHASQNGFSQSVSMNAASLAEVKAVAESDYYGTTSPPVGSSTVSGVEIPRVSSNAGVYLFQGPFEPSGFFGGQGRRFVWFGNAYSGGFRFLSKDLFTQEDVPQPHGFYSWNLGGSLEPRLGFRERLIELIDLNTGQSYDKVFLQSQMVKVVTGDGLPTSTTNLKNGNGQLYSIAEVNAAFDLNLDIPPEFAGANGGGLGRPWHQDAGIAAGWSAPGSTFLGEMRAPLAMVGIIDLNPVYLPCFVTQFSAGAHEGLTLTDRARNGPERVSEDLDLEEEADAVVE